MYANQLRKIVEADDRMKRVFAGISKCKEIGSCPKKPRAQILLCGSHWLLVFQKNNATWFFDSYGKPPSYYNLTVNRCPLVYNNITVQPLKSSSCGLYITFVLFHLSRGLSLEEIVKKFSWQTLQYNDKLVASFAKRHWNFNKYRWIFTNKKYGFLSLIEQKIFEQHTYTNKNSNRWHVPVRFYIQGNSVADPHQTKSINTDTITWFFHT